MSFNAWRSMIIAIAILAPIEAWLGYLVYQLAVRIVYG